MLNWQQLIGGIMMALATCGTVTGQPILVPERTVFESSSAVAAETEIDKLVFAKLAESKIEPVLCSDSVFVRRVYLDAIGTLPTAEEAKEFIQSTSSNKRSALIERLLERDEFADYWSMRWGDILKIKAEFPVNLWPNAAQAYHRWVRSSIASNKPYDQFVRELLTSSGSNFRVGPVNFYRAIPNRTPEGIANAVALTFMGMRTDSWPEDRLKGMAAFFSQVGYKPTREWKEENVYWDPFCTAATNSLGMGGAQASNCCPAEAVFPNGKKVMLSQNEDPRETFADWLVRPWNPWFTRCMANRTWYWLMGRGIIHEPDDIRPDNPPCHPALLKHLEQQFIKSRYDFKGLCRLILNSRTYQLSSVPPPGGSHPENLFAAYPLRRLDAEVLIDAINKVTGSSDLYTSAIPEPFTYIPADMPAVAIADGSITSPFLALFGRSARATGMESERSNKVLPAQWLHLLNSSHIQRKIEQSPKLRALIETRRKPAEVVEELYLTILSRFPTEQELRVLGQLAKSSRPGRSVARENWVDMCWALINSSEFLHRH